MKKAFAKYPSTRTRRRFQTGASVVELVTSMAVGTITIGGMTATLLYAFQQSGKAQAVTTLSSTGRRVEDEVLLQLRGGRQVLGTQTVSGVSFTTSANSVVFVSPGVSSSDILTTVNDYVAISYDNASKKVYESITPGTGSTRASRNKMLIARDVASLAFSYKVRDQFTCNASGTTSYTLSATPTVTPTVYVNGVARPVSSSNGKTVSVGSTNIGDDIEAVYTVSPTDTTALPYVSEIDVTVNGSTQAYGSVNATTQISGSARLRNFRS